MQAIDFDAVLSKIILHDPRYHRDAYHFLREALDHAQKTISKSNKGLIRHLTGGELLEGIREYALKEFGPMTLTVFEEWGITSGEHFGDMVFNMVEHGLLSKTEQDSREDFKGGYDFETAFRKPFLPTPGRQVKPASTTKLLNDA